MQDIVARSICEMLNVKFYRLASPPSPSPAHLPLPPTPLSHPLHPTSLLNHRPSLSYPLPLSYLSFLLLFPSSSFFFPFHAVLLFFTHYPGKFLPYFTHIFFTCFPRTCTTKYVTGNPM